MPVMADSIELAAPVIWLSIKHLSIFTSIKVLHDNIVTSALWIFVIMRVGAHTFIDLRFCLWIFFI